MTSSYWVGGLYDVIILGGWHDDVINNRIVIIRLEDGWHQFLLQLNVGFFLLGFVFFGNQIRTYNRFGLHTSRRRYNTSVHLEVLDLFAQPLMLNRRHVRIAYISTVLRTTIKVSLLKRVTSSRDVTVSSSRCVM